MHLPNLFLLVFSCSVVLEVSSLIILPIIFFWLNSTYFFWTSKAENTVDSLVVLNLPSMFQFKKKFEAD